MAPGRLPRWRIDGRIPIRAWVGVGGIGIVTTMLGEVMLSYALMRYEPPVAQYARTYGDIDEARYRSLPPVPAPSESAYLEGSLGAWSLGVGLLLAVIAALVGLSKVRIRWLLLRSLGALIVAVYSAVTLINVGPSVFFKFMYVNSTDCVEGCYFSPDPVGGWLGIVAIAAVVSGLGCAGLLMVAVVRSLLGKRSLA